MLHVEDLLDAVQRLQSRNRSILQNKRPERWQEAIQKSLDTFKGDLGEDIARHIDWKEKDNHHG